MKHILADWKMYLDFDETMILVNQLANETFDSKKVDVGIFPNFLAISETQKSLEDSDIKYGGQNCSWEPKGAYTGAISPLFLRSLDCKYVLLGHSERRHIFNEGDTDIRKKLEAALDAGLTPVLCVGETKAERESGETEYRIKKQIMKALENLDLDEKNIIVAYEPVWAISNAGVGESCDAEVAANMHSFIKEEIKNYQDKEIPVVYGGSVKAENVLEYVSKTEVDGVLVGNASTKLETFLPIIRAVENL